MGSSAQFESHLHVSFSECFSSLLSRFHYDGLVCGGELEASVGGSLVFVSHVFPARGLSSCIYCTVLVLLKDC